MFCVLQGETQVDEEVSSSGQDQGVLAMSVNGDVAQHFGPANTPRGEHCIYSQPY